MKTLVIDNYDSFTYNLVHYIEEITDNIPVVVRNDEFELEMIADYDCIVLSPGPGLPTEAGKMMQVIEKYHTSKIILGICLGHQALGLFFGGKLRNLSKVYHGVSSELEIVSEDIFFENLTKVVVGRYHSWVVDFPSNKDFPLIVTSRDQEGSIMSFKHKDYPVHGLQFHPESILTLLGKDLLKKFFLKYNL